MLSYDKIILKVFDGFKKLTPALVAIAIASGAMIFLPNNILKKLGLCELPPLWTTIIGLTFLISLSLIITIGISIVYKYIFINIKSKIRYKIRIKKLRKNFDNLSVEHKKIIIEILKSKNKSKELNVTSGDVIYLQQNKYIYPPQQSLDYFDYGNNIFKFVPQPWIIDYYIEQPELFKI